MQDIKDSHSLSMHVRRGDFVKLGLAFQPDDYRCIAERFVERYTADWELFVFSDDIKWCSENSSALGCHLFQKVHFVEGNTKGSNYIDLQLMSSCKGMLMSNSSFCFLAALLNENASVVYNLTSRKF